MLILYKIKFLIGGNKVMNKRIMFGSIISIIILIGVLWITPANVKANEIEEEKILEQLNNYSESLSKDSDFDQLIELHESLTIEDIFKQVLNSDNNNQIQDLADQYIELIDIEKINHLTSQLNIKFGVDFEELSLNVNRLYESNSVNYDMDTEEYYYKITEDENGIKINKQKTQLASENDIIIRGSDGAIKISNGEWITQNALDNLKEFLNMLIAVGAIASYAGIYLAMIGQLLAVIGFENIGYILFRFGFRFGVFALFSSIFSSALLMVIDILEKKFEEDTSKTCYKSNKFFEKRKNKQRAYKFFNTIFRNILRYFDNVNTIFN